MIGPEKEKQLASLFQAAPEHILSGLYTLLQSNAETDIDHTLLRLIEDAALARGVTLGKDEASEPLVLEDAAEPEPAPETSQLEPYEPPAFTPPRNAMHAFFLPFESLIIDPPRYGERIEGYLCSTSLPAIWRMLNEEASGVVIRDAWVKAELAKVQQQDEDFFRHVSGEMHAAARVVIDDIVARARDSKDIKTALLERLGGNAVFGDFRELHKMLPQIAAFKEEFDRLRPFIVQYSEDNAWRIADAISHAAEDGRSAINGYLQLAVLSNLSEPWQGLWLHKALNQQEAEGAPPVIAGHLIDILEMQQNWISARLFEDEQTGVLDPFIGFSDLLAGIAGERSVLEEDRSQDNLPDRLDTLVQQGAVVFEQMLEIAASALEAVLPMRFDDEQGEMPDLDWFGKAKGLDDLGEAARDGAMFLQAGGVMAPLYGKQEVWAELQEETVAIVRRYMEGANDQLEAQPEEQDFHLTQAAKCLLPVAEILAADTISASLREAGGLSSDAA